MLKYFVKKHKEDFLLCIGALTAGVLSFFVTLNVYPKIKDKQLSEEVAVTQTTVFSSVKEENVPEIIEEFDKSELEKPIIKIEVSEEVQAPEVEIMNESFENTQEESVNEILVEIKNEIYEIEPKAEEITEAFVFKKNLNFDWPLSGDIIKEFAVDSLVYSHTLDEWCTHEGIDIAGNENDVIVSVEDGIVERIFEDEKYGKTIVISHENGYETLYSFVAPQNLVKETQKVRKGEAIGRLTPSTNFELKDVTHLHFEMLKDGEKISPIAEIAKK